MIYHENQTLNKWLKIVNNKKKLKSMVNMQSSKIRSGNVFVILGANSYIGWALVCQLAYKFQGCSLILMDDNQGVRSSITKHVDLKTRVERLKYYFSFHYKIYSDISACKKHKPDFIINTLSRDITYELLELDFNKHLIHFSPFKSEAYPSDMPFKVTDFKIPTILGTCNLITLIDPILSTNNAPENLLNKILINAYKNKRINMPLDQYIITLSLEDITRALVKIIRRGQKKQFKSYHAYDKVLTVMDIVVIVSDAFFYHGINTDYNFPEFIGSNLKLPNKKPFLELIDKHRPPVEYMISYSCKNFLDARGE